MGFLRWHRRLRGALRAWWGLRAVPARSPADLAALTSLRAPALPPPDGHGAGVVFITARFRSGSTLLWNLFRHLPGCTAYYEPLNERRWFDPATRGSAIDPTHHGVGDYWREYEGLSELAALFRADWGRRDLYLDAAAPEPALQAYLEALISRSRGRPVLQFNRVDFRLPWLAARFPGASIVHLFRNPRDQWVSSLYGLDLPPDAGIAELALLDPFYLWTWAKDLRGPFPVLDPRRWSQPYELFYLVWKLSLLFGRAHAHHSLAYEALVERPAEALSGLLDALSIRGADLQALTRLVVPGTTGKWRGYADEAWFAEREARCESALAACLPAGSAA